VKALILAAGLGTRLRPLTYLRAKAAVPLNGEALVRRIVRLLVAQGIEDLVVNLHHHPQTITGALGDGSDLGARVRYSWENPVLGSGGGPRRALPLLDDDSGRFLIVNGDTLTDVDVNAVAATHDGSSAAVTMALIPNPRPDKYGGVLVENGRVTAFTRAGAAPASYHFIGVQVVRPDVFASLPEGVPAESVNGLYRQMIASDPRSIAAHVCHASFQDIGTPADYLDTALALAAAEGDRLRSPLARVAATAVVTRSVVWDDVTIGPGARIDACIVCDGVRVPPNAAFERCAILPAAGREPQGAERLPGDLLTYPIR
jgi:NDP-sugar pyrophosphorylase family protein